MDTKELIKQARANLQRIVQEKRGFAPPPPGDPSGGMPPGAPGMDPSGGAGGPPPGAGGPPPGMDPSGGAGGPPPGADPSMAQGGPGGPGQPVQLQMQDLMQLVQMLQGGGAAPATGGAPAPGGDPAAAGGDPAAAAGAKPKGKGGNSEVLDKLNELNGNIQQLIAFFTGVQAATGGGAPGGAPGGEGDVASMGAGTDQEAAPPMIDGANGALPMGSPPGEAAPAPAPAPEPKKASVKKASHDPKILNRIMMNLGRK